MPEKKNQHYVPKFHLKFWSGNKPNIQSFIKSTGKLISTSISDQVSKDYFYGKDLIVENLFGELEGNCAKIIDNLNENVQLEQYDEIRIKVFITTLYYRNISYKKFLDELIDSNIKEYLHILNETLDHVKLNINFSCFWKDYFSLFFFVFNDLKLELIDIDDSVYTNDNPVFNFNLYLNKQMNGIVDRGLVFIVALKPNLIGILYDEIIYGLDKTKFNIQLYNALLNANAMNVIFLNKNIKIKSIAKEKYENYFQQFIDTKLLTIKENSNDINVRKEAVDVVELYKQYRTYLTYLKNNKYDQAKNSNLFEWDYFLDLYECFAYYKKNNDSSFDRFIELYINHNRNK